MREPLCGARSARNSADDWLLCIRAASGRGTPREVGREKGVGGGGHVRTNGKASAPRASIQVARTDAYAETRTIWRGGRQVREREESRVETTCTSAPSKQGRHGHPHGHKVHAAATMMRGQPWLPREPRGRTGGRGEGGRRRTLCSQRKACMSATTLWRLRHRNSTRMSNWTGDGRSYRNNVQTKTKVSM